MRIVGQPWSVSGVLAVPLGPIGSLQQVLGLVIVLPAVLGIPRVPERGDHTEPLVAHHLDNGDVRHRRDHAGIAARHHPDVTESAAINDINPSSSLHRGTA